MNRASEALNKSLPLILFVICLVIAGILAWTTPAQWPAAMAIALAGAGIGLALRGLGTTRDTQGLEQQIVSLRHENTTLHARIDKSFSMIDELADVTEQVATMATEDKGPSVQNRLSALETAAKTAAQTMPIAAVATGAALVSTQSTATTTAQTNAASEPLTPIFEAGKDTLTDGDAVGYILGTGQTEDRGEISKLLAHVVTVASGLEATGREVRLFLRLSPDALAQPDVVTGILSATENSSVQRRLTILTSQAGFDYEAKDAVSRVFERGCPYALEGVEEWSPSLGPMGRAGLDFVIADAARALAAAEDDDPARLSRTLREHGVQLILNGIAGNDGTDLIRKLDPALVIGPADSGDLETTR